MEFSFPFSRYRWAVVTGAGMRWSRYRLDMNAHFQEVDGVTQLVPAPEGIVYNASKLNITSLTIPVLLEWQSPKHRRKAPRFFISGGVVGVVKTISSSKIVYHDADGEKRKKKMDRGMNLRPVTMDFLFQAGVGCIGLYAKYSPFGLFEKDKGPKVHPVSLGLQLHI
ncbi:Outer membrane protein beta-barrel domain protein [Parabacteroides merdae]|nr:PorT family protein [Parabacteroides merdae]QUT49128.1 Outer membrane protein beta-barrel domain protein [Parabacteroides merdae]